MDRATKEITTSGGHKVVLKTYLTQRETNDITKIDSLKDIDSNSVSNLPISIAMDFTNEVMKKAIVSMDDSADDLINRILELPASEASEIQTAVIAIFKLGFPQVK